MKCLRGFIGYRRPPKRPVGMLVHSDTWIAATTVDVIINIVWSGQW